MDTQELITVFNSLNPVFTNAFIVILSCYLPLYLITLFIKNNDLWNIFTRITSTLNAMSCVYMVINVITSENMNIYYNMVTEGDDHVITSLYWFAAYLFVDGVFYIPTLIRKPNFQTVMSMLHHFVGGLGIYLIAHEQLGLGLGLYFAGTEISTPLLNLSWILYNYNIKNLFAYIEFGIFYFVFVIARIFTIPILVNYLIYNHEYIQTLTGVKFLLAYCGSGTLALLNITWSIMLTLKIWGMLKSKKE